METLNIYWETQRILLTLLGVFSIVGMLWSTVNYIKSLVK